MTRPEDSTATNAAEALYATPSSIIGVFVADPSIRSQVESCLTEMGHQIHTTPPDLTGWRTGGGIDLLIIDQQYASRFGAHVERGERGSAAAVPILLLLPPDTPQVEWLDAGFDDILRLPISKPELADRLSRFPNLRAQSATFDRTPFDDLPLGVYRTTLDGRILLANRALLRMLGRSAPAEVAQLPLDLLLATTVPERAAVVAEIHARREIVGWESRWTRLDGRTLVVRESARIVDDERGEPAYIAGTLEEIALRDEPESDSNGGARDIESGIMEQHPQAGSLIESEKRLRALIDQSLDAALVLDDSGRYVDANPAACRLLGLSLDELRVANMPDFFIPTERDSALRKFSGFIERGQSDGVLRLRRNDGQLIDVEYQAIANFWPRLHLAILRDVTGRVQAETALRESEERFRTIFANAAIGIGLLTFSSVPIACNPAFEQMVGYTFDELKEIGIATITHPDDIARETVLVREVLAGIHDSYQLEKRYIRRDGSILWARLTVSLAPSGADGQPLVIGMIEDITDRKRAQQALRESEERFRMMFEAAAVGIVLVDTERNLLTANSALEAMLDYSQDELRQLPRETWVHPDDLSKDELLFEELITGSRDQYLVEKRYRHRDGSELWARLTVSLMQGQTVADPMVIMILENVTDRKRVEEQLLHDAFHDSLTGLPNRALFTERLDHLLARAARRSDYRFAVLFLDLDRFKVVNDSLGHLKGDQFLIAIAQRLAASVRPGDTVARLGGDEFTLLLEDLDQPSDAQRVADRIQQMLATPVVLDGVEVYTSASIGIALNTDEYDRSEHYLRDADAAMYHAKSLGRSRYEMFDSKMHADAVTRLQLESELRHAIDRQEFVVHYQPIISMADGNIAWFEALVRWQHPTRGLIAPDGFIPMAEETGLIVPIDRFVLQEACRQARAWQERFPDRPRIAVSVNLSGKQFNEPDLPVFIRSILQEIGLDGQFLRLEITESVVMGNIDLARATLRTLRQLGIHVDMDDFGTGYSSLGVLHSFPLNKLKIDRSFVDRIGDEEDRSEVVVAIVAMAHGLHLEVVAEGVESAEQLAKLRRMGCDYGQGYFFAHPLTQNEIEAVIRTNQVW